MTEFWGTWATPASLGVLITVVIFLFQRWGDKLDKLQGAIAGIQSDLDLTEDTVTKQLRELEMRFAEGQVDAERRFMTKDAHKEDMERIDARLGDISQDVKEIRKFLMASG